MEGLSIRVIGMHYAFDPIQASFKTARLPNDRSSNCPENSPKSATVERVGKYNMFHYI